MRFCCHQPQREHNRHQDEARRGEAQTAQTVAVDHPPADIADELMLLQDRVPPFDPQLAVKLIEEQLGARISEVFSRFDNPVSARCKQFMSSNR